MEVSATLKHAKFSAQKGRLVADSIRGLTIEQALNTLTFSAKSAAVVMKKVLNSAISNAESNSGLDIDELYVSGVEVNEGPTAKRIRPRAKGRADRIFKRTCHITVRVSDDEKQ